MPLSPGWGTIETMASALDWLYRRLGVFYFALHAAFDVTAAATVTLATVGLFSIYEPDAKDNFWEILAFAEAFVIVGLVWTLGHTLWRARPLIRWVARRGRDADAVEAWHTAVSLPREIVVGAGWKPFVVVAVPISVFITMKFDLPYYTAGVVFAGTLVAIAYAAILSFFTHEVLARPVLHHIARHLPSGFTAVPTGVPLRWKLLGSLPLINVITGVVVSGLSTTGTATLRDLGIDVVVAVVVAFTISFELTLLVTKSVLTPVRGLLQATERVKEGDLSTRVPVISGDELGELASSFNEMVTGLEEREKLRAAFGSYVDPEVAERVLEEGELLEGEEVEATLMFVDVRDFTAFSERASAREAVAYLNDLFGLVVPIVMKHGGHANKFIGDGLLAVFGAPERHSDHADRALGAAGEIARAVDDRYDGRLAIGIGINSGPVVAGTIGGGGRLEFTVIGDPVNVAARVEKATRDLGDTILCTEATRCLLSDGGARLESRGSVDLRGKTDPIAVYSPVPILAEKHSSSAADRTKVET